jgi:hypothetical protein
MKRMIPVDVIAIRASSEVLELPLPPVDPNEVDGRVPRPDTFGKRNAAAFNDVVKAFKIIGSWSVRASRRRGASNLVRPKHRIRSFARRDSWSMASYRPLFPA